MVQHKNYIISIYALAIAVFVWSAVNPKDYPTWVLETLPGIIAFIVLFFTRKKFPLTTLAYTLIAIHAVILFVGGKYTYAEVPLFTWIKEYFHHDRNNYDKVGHFIQGFVPAIIIREILIRVAKFKPSFLLTLTLIFICLGIAAAYEIIEFSAAMAYGQGAEQFLSTQGDEWDTQKDMIYCGVGAIISLLALSKFHNKQLQRFNQKPHG